MAICGTMLIKMKATMTTWQAAVVIVATMLISPGMVRSADRFWVAGSGNWSDTSHWSTSSGGGSGASKPSTVDKAIFDGNSGNCTINENIDVGGMLFTSAFANTVTQGVTRTIQVRTQHYVQDGGTFIGGTNLFKFFAGAEFTLSNGTFNAGNQIIRCEEDWRVLGGTLNPGQSTVEFLDVSSGYVTITGSHTLASVKIGNRSSSTSRNLYIAAGTTLTVTNVLTFDNNPGKNLNIYGGIIAAQGDIVLDGENYFSATTATLLINGTGNQTFTGSGGALGDVMIDKPSGSLFLAGIITPRKKWTYLNGTLVPGTSTIQFLPWGTMVISNSHTLGNIRIGNTTSSTTQSMTLDPDTTLTATGTVTFLGAGPASRAVNMYGGTIEAKGDISLDERPYSTGTATFRINGDGDQTFTGLGGKMPSLDINKTNGTLFLDGEIGTTASLWKYTSGDINAGTSTVAFWPNGLSITGSHTLANIKIGNKSGSTTRTLNLLAGTILTASGSLTYDNNFSKNVNVNIGTVVVLGDFNVLSNGTAWIAGSSLHIFSGSGDQTIDVTGAEDRFNCDILIDKSGGEVILASDLTMNAAGQDLTITNGTLNISSNRLNLTGSGSDFITTGTNVTLKMTLVDTNTMITVSGNTTIAGNLYITLGDLFLPVYNDTNVVLVSGNAVANTPFDDTDGYKVKYDVFYNDGGNNIKLAHISRLGGFVITIR